MSQSNLKQQFIMWAAGQILPNPHEAKPYLGALRLAIVSAIASGVMVAVGFSAIMYSLYIYLVVEGLNAGVAVMLCAGIAFLLAILGYVYAGRQLTKASHVTQAVELFPQRQIESGMNSLAHICKAAVYSFVDGLQEPVAPKPATAVTEAQHQIDKCLREIEALERRVEIELQKEAMHQAEQLAENTLHRH